MAVTRFVDRMEERTVAWKGFSILVHSLGLLGHKPPVDERTRLERRIATAMGEYPATPTHLCRVAVGMAKLSWTPEAEFLDALLRNALLQASNTNVQHICNLLWALSEMQLVISDAGGGIPLAWLDEMCSQLTVFFDDLVKEDITQLATALARLKYRPDDAFLNALKTMAVARFDEMDARCVTIYVFAMHKLDYALDDELWGRFMDKIEVDSERLKSQHVAMALWSFALRR